MCGHFVLYAYRADKSLPGFIKMRSIIHIHCGQRIACRYPVPAPYMHHKAGCGVYTVPLLCAARAEQLRAYANLIRMNLAYLSILSRIYVYPLLNAAYKLIRIFNKFIPAAQCA